MANDLRALKNRWLERMPENNRAERIWLLAKTEFKKRYYGSFLGMLWAFINPLVQLVIYYYVFTIIFKSRTENFSMFLFLGLIIWMFFTETSQKGIRLIHTKRYLLENIQINRLDIYYASILSSFFGFLFNFIVYFIISLLVGVNLTPQILLFPLMILNLVLFILGTQLILSIIHIFLRDIVHLWSLVVMVLFWTSGIFFEIDPGSTWKTAILAYLTPMMGIIKNSRAVMIYGEGFDWTLFAYDYAYAGFILMVGLWLQRRYFGRALEAL